MALQALKSQVKGLMTRLRLGDRFLAGVRKEAPLVAPRHKRFLSDRPGRTEAYLRGAREYVNIIREKPDYFDYLYMKPFDGSPGNHAYYTELYQVMNMLQFMRLPHAGRVLEIGSGPGWVTEILATLGFHVEAVEPCADMIEVARERLEICRKHHRPPYPGTVTYHCLPLEDCEVASDSCDAVLFHESLHHVIDENKGLAQCFRILRRGGVLGVTGEPTWWPGHHSLEMFLEEEMERADTLENPYTREYLEYLLHKHGFEEIERHHGVNGLFPVSSQERTLKEAAMFPAQAYNTYTARKPGFSGPTTADPNAVTRAEIRIREVRLNAPFHGVFLKVELTNKGETAWLHRPVPRGQVTLAMYQGRPRTAQSLEAEPRAALLQPVLPGQALGMDVNYRLPKGYGSGPWFLDLVCENAFWFGSRGSEPVEVKLPN